MSRSAAARAKHVLAATAMATAGVGLAAAWFARDPERVPPADSALILAPADGRLVHVGRPRQRLWSGVDQPTIAFVIVLALWDVHVQRSPVAGLVAEARGQPGPRWPAALPAARGNAGHWLVLETAWGQVVVHRQAGLIARRVTTTVATGQRVAAGERVGRIVLGSRCAVYVPAPAEILVPRGFHLRAGETPLARWPTQTSAAVI